MGRTNYSTIRDTILKNASHRFLESSSDGSPVTTEVYFYGNLGGGKSHILMALALDLFATFRIQSKKRFVVVIPDCGAMVDEGPITFLKKCFLLAFANSEQNLKHIQSFTSEEHFIQFSESVAKYDCRIFFVVDQDNVLDVKATDSLSRQAAKTSCRTLLTQLASQHFIIRGASANNESAMRRYQKQQNLYPIDVFGGFTEVCKFYMCRLTIL